MNDYERARERFDLSNFTVIETDIIGVELPDESQPLVRICTALLQAEVSIHYSYPLLFRRGGRGAMAVYVDDIDAGLKALSEGGLNIVTEGSLSEDDEFL